MIKISYWLFNISFLVGENFTKKLGKKTKKVPNPKNPSSQFIKTINQPFSYRIDQACHARLRHFSLLSRCVRSLVFGHEKCHPFLRFFVEHMWCVFLCFGGRGMYIQETKQSQTSSKSNNGCFVGCKMI